MRPPPRLVPEYSVLLAWSTVRGYGRPLHDEEDQMLRAGDVIENPVTGETITFIRTSEDTGGAQLEIELLLRPNAFLPAAHVHPTQEEAFTVLEGAVRFTSGAHVDVVRAGGTLLVPGGQPHSWGPDGDAGARVRVAFSPPGADGAHLRRLPGCGPRRCSAARVRGA